MNDTNGAPQLPHPAPAPTPAPKNNYAWIGYFVFLIVASVGVAVFMIMYNMRQQLTRDKLEAAEKLWSEKGPKSYKMVYTEQHQSEATARTFAVTVRDKKVEDVRMDGKALTEDPDRKDDLRSFYSMVGQFLILRRYLDLCEKPGVPKAFFVAHFDPQTGALLGFRRNVRATGESVEVFVTSLEALKD